MKSAKILLLIPITKKNSVQLIVRRYDTAVQQYYTRTDSSVIGSVSYPTQAFLKVGLEEGRVAFLTRVVTQEACQLDEAGHQPAVAVASS